MERSVLECSVVSGSSGTFFKGIIKLGLEHDTTISSEKILTGTIDKI